MPARKSASKTVTISHQLGAGGRYRAGHTLPDEYGVSDRNTVIRAAVERIDDAVKRRAPTQ